MVLKTLQLSALLSHLHFLSLFKLSTQEITGFNLSTVGCTFGHVNMFDSLGQSQVQLIMRRMLFCAESLVKVHGKPEGAVANQWLWLWIVCISIFNRHLSWFECNDSVPLKALCRLHWKPPRAAIFPHTEKGSLSQGSENVNSTYILCVHVDYQMMASLSSVMFVQNSTI